MEFDTASEAASSATPPQQLEEERIRAWRAAGIRGPQAASDATPKQGPLRRTEDHSDEMAMLQVQAPVLPQPNLQTSKSSNPSPLHATPTPSQCIRVATSESHSCHQLFYIKGVIYCRRCGNYGTVKFRNLLKERYRPENTVKWRKNQG